MDLAEAFPVLTPGQLELVALHAEEYAPEEGEPLFLTGQRDFCFYVVLEGGIRISERSTGVVREIAVHTAGQFSGDVDQLTGRSAFVDAHALAGTRVLRVGATQIRRLLAGEPQLSDTLMRAFQARRKILEGESDFGVEVLGSGRCPEANRLREFLYKNRVPHRYVDVREPAGELRRVELGIGADELPATAGNGQIHRRPDLRALASCLGLAGSLRPGAWDLVIVGCGPAGLAAAVYAASEGLSTLVMDSVGPGGQAGSSSRIENYMGFPSGTSGAELANLGYLQAMRFGATFSVPQTVESFETAGNRLRICTRDGCELEARTLLIATGASYRQLEVPGSVRFQDAGLFQSATSVEERVCRQATAVVVGGGNSAGQAAMYLAEQAERVLLVLRGGDLRKTMSSYLADRVEVHPRIEVRRFTELAGLEGHQRLERALLKHNRTGQLEAVECAAVFTFIGAKPHTDWCPSSVARDAHGFLLTGSQAPQEAYAGAREPCQLETSLPNVFAAGDVRSGSTKRVAFAVGDGALAVTCVHQALARGG